MMRTQNTQNGEGSSRKVSRITYMGDSTAWPGCADQIETLCKGITREEATAVAACFLPKKGGRRLGEKSPSFSNELLQYNCSASYQSKGAFALKSPIDPSLPRQAQEPLPWKKDEVISMNTSRDEETMKALLSRVDLKGCPFRFEVTSDKPTIKTLKPDMVLILKGFSLSEYSAIGAFINVKSTTDGLYDSDECVGKTIVYGQEFLLLAGPERDSIVVGVTDLEMITFKRSPDAMFVSYYMSGFTVVRGEPSSNVLQVLSACLQADPLSLDVKSAAYWRSFLPEATSWMRVRYLGRGLTSHVHLVVGADSKKNYALKMARKGHKLDNDIKFLSQLAGIDGIPIIHQICDSSTIILELVGEAFTRANLRHHHLAEPQVSKLVDILESAHWKDVVNRDIRIENVMIASSHKSRELRLFLLDWGFAAKCGAVDNGCGSLITASDSVLKQHIQGCTQWLYTFVDDLVSLVRCLFLFYKRQVAIQLYDDPTNPKFILDFWKKAMNNNKLWQEAEQSALRLDYSAVKMFLTNLQSYAD